MSAIAVFQLLFLAGVSFSVALAALWVVGWAGQRAKPSGRLADEADPDRPELIFENETLFDASPGAFALLPDLNGSGCTLSDFVSLLSPRFPGLEEALADLPEARKTCMAAVDGLGQVRLEWRDGLIAISIEQKSVTAQAAMGDQTDIAAMENELETLRATVQAAPFLVWRQEKDGRIVWANNSYLELSRLCDAETEHSVWPPQMVFKLSDDDILSSAHEASDRVSVSIPGQIEPRWFERHAKPLGNDILFMAASIDATVAAETALRDFVQTLTKTFAHLRVGLAIFDKQRKLALFNPALSDLTQLRPEFLSMRPTLQAFLDQLRDKRMIPEPRDYRSWRQQIYELESAAKEGTYEETWPLPNGLTYRVSGRPHPDGALAFLFEDKSAEISLTRRYRTELETGQAVLDSIDEALAVFSPSGTLTASNAAYARLWASNLNTRWPVCRLSMQPGSGLPAARQVRFGAICASLPARLANARSGTARCACWTVAASIAGLRRSPVAEPWPDLPLAPNWPQRLLQRMWRRAGLTPPRKSRTARSLCRRSEFPLAALDGLVHLATHGNI